MNARKAQAPADQPGEGSVPRIDWDTSGMQSTYANVCNVASTREEVVFLFGVNQAWQGGQEEVKVELSNRIILTPHAAKRLATLLGNVLREYESRFGELNVGDPQQAPGRVTPTED